MLYPFIHPSRSIYLSIYLSIDLYYLPDVGMLTHKLSMQVTISNPTTRKLLTIVQALDLFLNESASQVNSSLARLSNYPQPTIMTRYVVHDMILYTQPTISFIPLFSFFTCVQVATIRGWRLKHPVRTPQFIYVLLGYGNNNNNVVVVDNTDSVAAIAQAAAPAPAAPAGAAAAAVAIPADAPVDQADAVAGDT
jgi:hypothetical protein